MSPFARGLIWGFVASALLYVVFVVRRILEAGTNKAIGVGVLVVVFTEPLFWILVVLIFVAVFVIAYKTNASK